MPTVATLIAKGLCDSSFEHHVAFEAPGIGCENEWLEPVADEQYALLA